MDIETFNLYISSAAHHFVGFFIDIRPFLHEHESYCCNYYRQKTLKIMLLIALQFLLELTR